MLDRFKNRLNQGLFNNRDFFVSGQSFFIRVCCVRDCDNYALNGSKYCLFHYIKKGGV